MYSTSHEAVLDWRDIIEYTIDRFGEDQVRKYSDALILCMEAMAKNKVHFKDLTIENHTIRVKHCQRHYIFGLLLDDQPMIIITFLHEKMDLMKRLKGRLE